jgi:calcium-independent phospholipase A2
MAYVVKAVANEVMILDLLNEAIETKHYPTTSERANTCGGDVDFHISSTIHSCVQAKLLLLPLKYRRSSWQKRILHYAAKSWYEILFIQSEETKEAIGWTLYQGQDASSAMNAFDQIHQTISRLMEGGSVFLTESLLKEIILPKPLLATQLAFRLVEVMEADPRAHPKWHKVLQALLDNAYCYESREEEIKMLLEKGSTIDGMHTVASTGRRYTADGLRSQNKPGAVNALIMKKHHLRPQNSGEDIDIDILELHNAINNNDATGIWDYCRKIGLTTVQLRKRRIAVALDKPPLLKQKTVDVYTESKVTPLILAIQKQYIKSTLLLLIGGADPNQHHPDNGDTPLHYAVKLGNIILIKLLLVFGANPKFSNDDAVSSLQLAHTTATNPKLVTILEEMVQLQDKTWEYFAKNNNLEKPEPKKTKELYLLAMDGGGIRIFNTCQAFIAIEDRMKQLDPSCSSFFSYFDYIAGTSAGAVTGLIAAYTDAPTSISRALTYKLVTDVFSLPKLERDKQLEKYLIEILGENTSMSHPIQQKVIVTTTLGDRSPCKLHLMTNYGNAKDGQCSPQERKVWEAAKASSAAPYFFPPFNGKFLDGGLMANNPTLDALVEMQLQIEKEETQLKIGCVLSLGTGHACPKPIENVDVFVPRLTFKAISSIQETLSGIHSLVDMFINQVTQSDGQEVERARGWCKSMETSYYRLSPQLMENVDPLSFDEESIINMLYEDQKYLLNQPEVIDSIAKRLLSKQKN